MCHFAVNSRNAQLCAWRNNNTFAIRYTSMNNKKYILSAATAYFIWGFFAFGLKPISIYPPIEIMSYRLYLCVVVLVSISFIFRKKKLKVDYQLLKNMHSKERTTVIISAIAGAIILLLNWLGYIYVVNEVNVQTAGLTYLICPLLTTLLGVIVLKEKLGKEKWIALGLGTIACLLLSAGHFHEMYMAILVALAFAVYLIIQRKLNKFDSFNLLTVQATIIAIVLTPIFLLQSNHTPVTPTFMMYIAIIVGLFTIAPMFLNNYALKGINSSTAGILIYINPIVIFLLAIFYFKEPVTLTQGIAYGIICFAVLLFNIKLLKPKKG